MDRSRWIAAIAVSGMIVFASAVAGAQDEDRDACVDSCHQVAEQCVESCGTHANPVECEEGCQDREEDCTRECR
ncbi:MAG: hypothetical protein JRE43_00280 [Deltaproteobacteria bacterium]|jgi:hypothetical protein|nr:hypothetical protein [Deltaproteobacteria bacterium]